MPHEELECYVLMLDLDNFKTINDTYGHIAGDKTLIFVARVIWSIIRESDKAYRYGGDELVVIFDHSTLENVKTIAEKIRSTIEKNHLLYDKHAISLTVSIGISQISQLGFEASIIRTDEALYHAKQNGKNKVYVLELPAE